ncbi:MULTISPECIES: hypothetical protein [Nocardia]|uniref:hypothetical protein n=1 Tax=Nocardia TaxID=1817 RepID=UPI00030A0FC6|nr:MULTISPECIES: hypothetical protein [Nocardia]
MSEVSVMLPAYLATGFRHRGGVVPATLVFGAGVATLILPNRPSAALLGRGGRAAGTGFVAVRRTTG